MARRPLVGGVGAGRRRPLAPAATAAAALLVLLLCATPPPALAQHRGPRVLVLFDDAAAGRETHARFLGALAASGYQADVRSADDPALALRDGLFGWRYDHVALLAPRAAALGGDGVARRAAAASARKDKAHEAEPPAPSLDDLAAMVEEGAGNVLLALSPDSPDALRALALELGVEMDARGARVHDHFSRPEGLGDGKGEEEEEGPAVLARDAVASAAILGAVGLGGAPVIYRGGAAVVPASSSGTATVVLSASPTAYTHVAGAGPPGASSSAASLPDPAACPNGGAAALAVAVRARNNARVAVVGSLYALSDAAISAKGFVDASTGEAVGRTANAEFAAGLARWAFADRGVLLLERARHRILPGGSTGSEDEGADLRNAPELLRINDEVEFSVDVWELEGGGSGGRGKAAGTRSPYVPPPAAASRDASAAPVQLSFTMLDPHVRLALAPADPSAPNGTLSLRFRAPDVYGVFKFTLDHARAGYSRLELSAEAPVRPYRHDEYERFLAPAYPYYASALSATAAVFMVVVVVLYSKE